MITEVRNRTFIELIESNAFGMVHISTLKDDLYRVTDSATAIYGRRTRKTYQVGQKITSWSIEWTVSGGKSFAYPVNLFLLAIIHELYQFFIPCSITITKRRFGAPLKAYVLYEQEIETRNPTEHSELALISQNGCLVQDFFDYAEDAVLDNAPSYEIAQSIEQFDANTTCISKKALHRRTELQPQIFPPRAMPSTVLLGCHASYQKLEESLSANCQTK